MLVSALCEGIEILSVNWDFAQVRLGFAFLGVVSLLLLSPPRLFSQTWIPTAAPNTNWISLATSADGTRLIATTAWPWQEVFISTNRGDMWNRNSLTGYFTDVACSADAAVFLAVGGGCRFSTNSGVTWTVPVTPNLEYAVQGQSCACSADGKTMYVAANESAPTGLIYVSTNSGANWDVHSTVGLNAIACSADGRVAICAGSGGYHGFAGLIQVSTNWGADRTTANFPMSGHGWDRVAASADGRTLFATMRYAYDQTLRGIYRSTDSGTTWSPTTATNIEATCLTVSANGQNVVYAQSSGEVFRSDDGGNTWSNFDTFTASDATIISSADGATLFGMKGSFFLTSSGFIYRSTLQPLPQLRLEPWDTGLRLSWLVPSKPYVLQFKTNSLFANWNELDALPVLNPMNLNYEVTVPRTAESAFFRLIQTE